jgi:hypothetical protein
MHQFIPVLDEQIDTVELLLLRLTTVRLLMASGQHQLVARGLEDVETAFAHFDVTLTAGTDLLRATGHDSLQDAIAGCDGDLAAELEQRGSRLRALERDLHVLISSTANAAQAGLEAGAMIDLSAGRARVEPATTRGFLTGQL